MEAVQDNTLIVHNMEVVEEAEEDLVQMTLLCMVMILLMVMLGLIVGGIQAQQVELISTPRYLHHHLHGIATHTLMHHLVMCMNLLEMNI